MSLCQTIKTTVCGITREKCSRRATDSVPWHCVTWARAVERRRDVAGKYINIGKYIIIGLSSPQTEPSVSLGSAQPSETSEKLAQCQC